MIEIIIAFLGMVGTAIGAFWVYKKDKGITQLKVAHEKEMAAINSKYVLELQKLKDDHERNIQEANHKHEIEILRF